MGIDTNEIKANISRYKELFHVHTRRCEHAGDETDEDYVNTALRLNATKIVFTDHAPFPGDPFRNRMKMEQLPEYIESLNRLKRDNERLIEITVGLEIEYLPRYEDYYRELLDMEGLELLVLGQHMAQTRTGEYTFNLENKSEEYRYLAESMIQGLNTGYFTVVAHPDRIFKRVKGGWTDEMTELSKQIIQAAKKNNVLLEINSESIQSKVFRQEFWDLVPSDMAKKAKHGIDAHCCRDLVNDAYSRRTNIYKQIKFCPYCGSSKLGLDTNDTDTRVCWKCGNYFSVYFREMESVWRYS